MSQPRLIPMTFAAAAAMAVAACGPASEETTPRTEATQTKPPEPAMDPAANASRAAVRPGEAAAPVTNDMPAPAAPTPGGVVAPDDPSPLTPPQ